MVSVQERLCMCVMRLGGRSVDNKQQVHGAWHW